jgi:hypothetical protein
MALRPRSLVRLFPTLAAWALAASAGALPMYRIVPLGFTDAEHTRDDGYQSSTSYLLTGSGYALGSSIRYGGGASAFGQSVWVYDPADGRLHRAGLVDETHTRNDGYQSSSAALLLTESGYAAGSSARFDGGASYLGGSAWVYDPSDGSTTRTGLFDGAHTRSDGYQFSAARLLTESGYATGYSYRYGVPSSLLGQSAWVYDASDRSTTRVGLFDGAYTRSDGYQFSVAYYLTESGYAAGNSSRFDGGTDSLGQSAWVYDASDGTTTRVGLLDGIHTRDDGYQYSFANRLTESGYAAGGSYIYGGGASFLGQSAWVYDPSDRSITRVGYFDAAHTQSDGRQSSTVGYLTESGLAAGISTRFDSGQSAWLYRAGDGSTTRMGFFDGAYTRSDGFQSSTVGPLTESGYAAGISYRFDGGATPLGPSAWIYDASDGSTTRVGLFDGTHTRSDGFQQSRTDLLAESGYATGTSYRYGGGAALLGESAWVYDPSDHSTTRAGLFDGVHVRSDGYASSAPSLLTDSGYVAGGSSQFPAGAGNFAQGDSAWVYDPSDHSTTRVGLFDGPYVREEDGAGESSADFLTESGFVAGFSLRYGSGFTDLGQTAWVYDASTDAQSAAFLFSERSDGYAYSSVSFLGEDGLALGSYTLFDAEDADLGSRAFAWTPEDGAVDLGSLVAGGLTAEGWSYLASAIRANGLDQILGQGRLLTGGDLAYLLVPVPEPGTGWLVAAALLGLAQRGRRKARRG